MKTTFKVLLGSLAIMTLVGCSGAEPSDARTTSSDEAALSTRSPSAATVKKVSRNSISFFGGGDGKRTRQIELDDAPAEVKSVLTESYQQLVESVAEWGDVEAGVYELFGTVKKKKIVGYAVWAYGTHGDGGRGVVQAFTLDGTKVYDEEDGWSED